MVDGIPRLATPEYVLRYKKNPLIIQPSWSVKPFSPEDNFKSSFAEGSATVAYPILMAKMKAEVSGSKIKMGGMAKWIFILVIGAIIGYALFTGGS